MDENYIVNILLSINFIIIKAIIGKQGDKNRK